MLHAGIGETHLNNLLFTLNLPQISHRILKRREVEIACVIETFAKKSVDNALLKEQELTKKNEEFPDCESQNVRIEVSEDAAWQRRGS